MKHIVLIFIFLFTGILTSFAQRIYFCNNYNTIGEPIGSGYTWEINANGGNVYILFQNGGKPLNASIISFYFDYLSGTEYKVWDTKVVNVSSSNTWQVLDYKFTIPNNYRVSVWISGIEVAKEYITIKLIGSATAANNVSTPSSSSSTLYYSASSVVAGTSIDLTSGYVYGMNGPFYLNASYTSKVYFKVSNGGKKLSTNKLIVDIHKMNSSGTYDFYTTTNYDISDLDWVTFNYDFYAAGKYKVSVNNGTSTWINTTYVTINGSSSGSGSTNISGSSGDYYTGSGVTAGSSIDSKTGYVYGIGGPFKRTGLVNKKINVYFKVSNGDKKLNTYKLIVDIYKKSKKGNYEFYTTKKYNIADLNWVYFTYEFHDDGQYEINVHNSNNAWINTTYITIN
jgi:hypothetical protein